MSDNNQFVTLSGKVTKILAIKDDNYCVFKVDNDHLVRGNFENLIEGKSVQCKGYWDDNPKFGRQFLAKEISYHEMSEEEAIFAILSSGKVKYIGSNRAKEIVELFGEDALKVIESQHSKLTRIKGINPERASQIRKSWMQIKNGKSTIIKLIRSGFEVEWAIDLFNFYKKSTMRIITDNPYAALEALKRVSFETIDVIAQTSFSVSKKSAKRIQAGVIYYLKDYHFRSGSTLIPVSLFFNLLEGKLINNSDLIMREVKKFVSKGKIKLIKIDGRSYFQMDYVFDSEKELAEKIVKFAVNSKPKKIDGFDIDEKLNDGQRAAVRGGIKNKLSVITGKPGVGKTTIINELVRIFRENGEQVALTSFTGLAAENMSVGDEVIGQTIHRLLQYNPASKEFDRNEDNPLDADVVILDEASMVDMFMFLNLVRALSPSSRLIMIGDIKQLPSVDCGAIFRDLIHSKFIPEYKVTKIYRYDESSKIAKVAHSIDEGNDDFLYHTDDDVGYKFYPSNSDAESLRILKDVVNEMGFYKIRKSQILTPVREGVIGVGNINHEIKQLMNPNKFESRLKFGLKDKVIQNENNYNKDVFNGETGIVNFIDRFDVKVGMKNREVIYDRTEMSQLSLAYAVTIHKSQGSEYDTVIMVLPEKSMKFIDRSLLYTAATRAKKKLILIGSREVITNGVNNQSSRSRVTNLNNWINRFAK